MTNPWRLLTLRGKAFVVAGLAICIAAWLFGQRDVLWLGLFLILLPVIAVFVVVRTRLRLACERHVDPAQVVPLSEVGPDRPGIVGLSAAFLVPDVDGGLHGVAFGEQFAVFRPERGDDIGQGGEEGFGRDAGCGEDFPGDDVVECFFDGQAGDGDAV